MAKLASTAAARAMRTGVVMNGMFAFSRRAQATSDLALRPDHTTLSGLSVEAAALAMAWQALVAASPLMEARRIETWSMAGSARTISSVLVKSVGSLKTPAVVSAGFSDDPKEGMM